MKRWEVQVLEYIYADWPRIASEQGQDGWELVTVLQRPDTELVPGAKPEQYYERTVTRTTLVFKREAEPDGTSQG